MKETKTVTTANGERWIIPVWVILPKDLVKKGV